jgi:hypothetical protein
MRAACRLAVERALSWYISERPAATASALPVSEAAALADALAGRRPLTGGLFELLTRFAQLQWKLATATGAPACNLGDVLTAFADVPPAEGGPTWSFAPEVDIGAFAKLGFAAASEGIARTQRANREGWWKHAQKSRAFITAAAARVERPRLAVVLGGGQGFDLPLVELAERFERLVLVDIDAAALDATIAGVFKDARLRARVEPRVVDLSGVNGALVRGIDESFAAGGGAAEVEPRLARLCRSYRLPDGAQLGPPGERPDLLVSALVVSQVAWPQRAYALRLWGERFGKPYGAAEKRLVEPWWELELRMQQDHVGALAAAEMAVLTADVVGLPTALDASGTERPVGRRICGLGVEQLRERIPQTFAIEAHATWTWARYQPDRKGGEGLRMEVEAMQLRPARPTS